MEQECVPRALARRDRREERRACDLELRLEVRAHARPATRARQRRRGSGPARRARAARPPAPHTLPINAASQANLVRGGGGECASSSSGGTVISRARVPTLLHAAAICQRMLRPARHVDDVRVDLNNRSAAGTRGVPRPLTGWARGRPIPEGLAGPIIMIPAMDDGAQCHRAPSSVAGGAV